MHTPLEVLSQFLSWPTWSMHKWLLRGTRNEIWSRRWNRLSDPTELGDRRRLSTYQWYALLDRASGKTQRHAVSANRILWVYAGFWWYHGILVVHLQDSGGAFWAIKDQDTSIRGLSVENVMTDGLSRVCIWWCIMLSLITKITGIYFVGEKC